MATTEEGTVGVTAQFGGQGSSRHIRIRRRPQGIEDVVVEKPEDEKEGVIALADGGFLAEALNPIYSARHLVSLGRLA